MKLQMEGSEEFNFPYAIVNYSLRLFDMTDTIQFDIFFIEAAIMNDTSSCQSSFFGIVKPTEINKNFDKDVEYFETKVNEHSAIVYNDSVELYCALENFLSKASVCQVYTLSNRKLDLSSKYLSLCESNTLPILRNIIYLQEAIFNQIMHLGFNLCRERVPYSAIFQLLHVDRTCNKNNIPDKLNNLNNLIIAFRKGIELKEYDKSCIQTYCEKESPYQYTELNAYMKRKSILKAINIAGCSANFRTYIKNLEVAHFKECEISILKDYYSFMRYEYTLNNKSNWLSQNILTSPPLYPTIYIKKYLGDELYEKAEQLSKKVITQKKYISALKSNNFLEPQVQSALRLFNNKNIVPREYRYSNNISNRQLLESNTMCIRESYNAIKARKNGLFTEEDITQEKLERFGFGYSKDFFIWLRKMKYIISKEIHHINDQGKWKNIYFYDDSSLTYIVDKLDLDFLYKLFTNQITYDDALVIKNITFCKVKAIPEIIGKKTGEPVITNCVKQNNTFWFSKDKYIKQQNNNIIVLSLIDIEKEPNSSRYNKIAKKLLSYKHRKIKRILV